MTPVEEIKNRLDIVEVVSDYIPLKQAGQSFKARCPFHNEKTPSFMVSRERGSWHCFGCGRGGDIFSFVQEMEGLDFPEALRILAKKAGIELKPVDPKLHTQRTKAMDVLRWVTKFYQEVFRKSAEAEAARAYLQRRGLDDTTIDLFALGFAPGGWDGTYAALRKKGFSDEDIFQAGLTIKKERGTGFYDRFRGRVMFPIRDANGAVVGFTGRVLDEKPDEQGRVPAKYVNSPQTVVYNKSGVLYGFDLAKRAIKQAGFAVVVEGNMDLIASHQFNVTNAVAVSGTALTADQVRLIRRLTNRIVFAFDQDTAGVQAAVRALDQVLAAGLDVAVARLGEAKDPDELIRRDPAAWPKAIATAVPVMEYFFGSVTADRDLSKVNDKKLVTRELLPIVGKLGDPVEQSHYVEKLADLVHVGAEDLRKMLPGRRPTAPPAGEKLTTTATAPKPAADRHGAVTERLLALLIYDPQLFNLASAKLNPDILVGVDLQDLYRTLVVWYSEHHFVTRQELDARAAALTGDVKQRFTLLSLLADKEFSPDHETPSEEEFLSLTGALTRHALSRRLRQIEAEMSRLERAGQSSTPAMTTLLDQARELTEQIRSLG